MWGCYRHSYVREMEICKYHKITKIAKIKIAKIAKNLRLLR